MPSESYLSFDVDFGVEGLRQIPLTCSVTTNGNGWGQGEFLQCGCHGWRMGCSSMGKAGVACKGNLVFTLRVHKGTLRCICAPPQLWVTP